MYKWLIKNVLNYTKSGIDHEPLFYFKEDINDSEEEQPLITSFLKMPSESR